MGKFTLFITLFLVLFEISLLAFYYQYLVPLYNLREYSEKPVIASQNDVNCSLFITQNEAQSFYLQYNGEYKLGSLDNDNDGVVCENLP